MAEPLGTLLKGLKAKWDTATPSLGAPLYLGEKPTDEEANPASGTQFPYAIFPPDLCYATTLSYTTATILTELMVVFRLYQTTPEGCKTLADAVKAIFDSDGLTLTLDEGALVRHRPAAARARYIQDDKTVWHLDLPYEFLTEKARVN
jgi:hypothetical protein